MNCPECGEDSSVLESRKIDGTIRRRRECKKCSNRFTTRENIEGGFNSRLNKIYTSFGIFEDVADLRRYIDKKVDEAHSNGIKEGMELAKANQMDYNELLKTKVKPKMVRK